MIMLNFQVRISDRVIAEDETNKIKANALSKIPVKVDVPTRSESCTVLSTEVCDSAVLCYSQHLLVSVGVCCDCHPFFKVIRLLMLYFRFKYSYTDLKSCHILVHEPSLECCVYLKLQLHSRLFQRSNRDPTCSRFAASVGLSLQGIRTGLMYTFTQVFYSYCSGCEPAILRLGKTKYLPYQCSTCD